MNQNYTKVTLQEVMHNLKQEVAALSALVSLNLSTEELDVLEIVGGRFCASLETLTHLRTSDEEEVVMTPPVTWAVQSEATC